MAGITGIIFKNERTDRTLEVMMEKLAYDEAQLKRTFSDENIAFGNVMPISSKQNDHFVLNEALQIYAIIDGFIFIDQTQRNLMARKYKQTNFKNAYELIPYLYDYYGVDATQYFTGVYNVCIYSKKNQQILLFNDRLGFLPLYYYESPSVFIFSSKIESILSSGFLPKIKFDYTTIAEHLLFNYPLSDHTYIKNIHTLPSASYVVINSHQTIHKKYWNIGNLFGLNPVSSKESFDLLNDSLQKSIYKMISRKPGDINFSLTGGWDSRVLLAYLLPDEKNRLRTYSFGTALSPDIQIPNEIAEKEGLNHTPYILDNNYLYHSFLPHAKETIKLSNGTRNYKRTHYLYAIKQQSKFSDTLISGIWGDEIFKVGKPVTGTVISSNTLNLFESNFDLNQLFEHNKNKFTLNLAESEENNVFKELESRIQNLNYNLSQYKTLTEKFYAFRFEINLRKYFGNEANSYNDFMHCFSPFTDYDFLKDLSQTSYWGPRYHYNSSKIKDKRRSTFLYQKVTRNKYKPLIYYNSSRGYSMANANSLTGTLKIIFQKLILKIPKIDAYNTDQASNLFIDFLKSNKSEEKWNISLQNQADYYSLKYWQKIITEKYTD